MSHPRPKQDETRPLSQIRARGTQGTDLDPPHWGRSIRGALQDPRSRALGRYNA